MTVEEFERVIPKEIKDFFKKNKKYDMTDVYQLYMDILLFPADEKSGLDGTPELLTYMYDFLKGDTELKTFISICSIEKFLDKILYVNNTEEYMKKYNDVALAPIIRALNLNKAGINFMDEKAQSKRTFWDYYYHLSEVYKLRNKDAHEYNMFSPLQRISYIYSVLIVELVAISEQKEQVRKGVKSVKNYDYEQVVLRYLKDRKEIYEVKNRDFIYIQTEYEKDRMEDEETDIVIQGTADSLLKMMDEKNIPRIKFCGSAGMGKTKMAEYLEYTLLKKRLEKRNSPFPIYLECNTLNSCNKTKKSLYALFYQILDEYHTDSKILYGDILKNEHVFLIIDGLNEIQDINQKMAFISDLKRYIDVNHKVKMVLTERPNANDVTITGSTYVSVFQMKYLSDMLVRNFLDAYLPEKEKKASILEKMEESEFKKYMQTPYYISKMIEIVKEGEMVLPNDKIELMRIFVKKMIKREKDKGEAAANYAYLMPYLISLNSEYLYEGACGIDVMSVVDIFAKITKEKTLTSDIYAADHLLALFEELNFIRVKDDKVYIEELFSDFLFYLELEKL